MRGQRPLVHEAEYVIRLSYSIYKSATYLPYSLPNALRETIMSLAHESLDFVAASPDESLHVCLARTAEDIAATQRLRHQVFIQEMGANLPDSTDGLEQDEFDPHCLHLMVTDTRCGQLVGSTRLLLNEGARAAGMFYSETEFHLQPVLSLGERLMEVSRTCIRPEYRTGAAIRTLWNGIALQVIEHDIDYLFGCASLPMNDQGAHAQAIMDRIRPRYFTTPDLRVAPRLALAEIFPLPYNAPAMLPALLKAYLRLGARVGGEACWDPLFNVADVFVLLNRDQLAPRYARSFLECA